MRNLLHTIIKYKYLFILLLLFFLFFAAVEIKAQGELDYTTYDPEALGEEFDLGQEGKLAQGPYLKRTFDIFATLPRCQIVVDKACSADAKTRQQMSNRSVLGVSSQAIAMVYAVPPAGVGPFIADAAQRAGFVDKAWAQGIGFASLAPLIPVWRAFRNATYAVMILVLLVFGFLIMLRRQIDPQTVITIQNSLPRIVITLVLITFSYAIAGFIIDLMYLVILLTIGLFNSVGLIDLSGVDNAAQRLLTGGVWEFGKMAFGLVDARDIILGSTGAATLPAIGFLLGSPIPVVGNIGGAIVGMLAAGMLSNFTTGDLTGGGFGNYIGSGFSPIASLLIAIIFAFAFLRLLLMLISSYIQIIVNIVFAPLQLVADVIPGGGGFFDWITNLIGHALVFPITIAMIIVGHAIAKSASGGTLWSPPLIFQSGGFIQSLIGLGVIMLIPNITGSIREKFKATAPGGVTGGAITGAAMRPVSVTGQAVSTLATVKTLKGGG